MTKTVVERFAQLSEPTVFSRAELLAAGSTGEDFTRAVKQGTLLRLRRDHYAPPDVEPEITEAVGIGGRVTCLSLLQMIGVFVLSCSRLHVQLQPHASRIRLRKAPSARLHWVTGSAENSPRHMVPLRDAVGQAIRCQGPRAAIATLDSVLHHRLMTFAELHSLFEDLPHRFRALLTLVDATAESGPETFMRLILRSLGAHIETQVYIAGVGRVDFLVNGWLIIECDSKEHHEGWEKQRRDRARDIAAARLGYVTVRPLAADIMSREGSVRAALSDIIEALGPRFDKVRLAQLRRIGG